MSCGLIVDSSVLSSRAREQNCLWLCYYQGHTGTRGTASFWLLYECQSRTEKLKIKGSDVGLKQLSRLCLRLYVPFPQGVTKYLNDAGHMVTIFCGILAVLVH